MRKFASGLLVLAAIVFGFIVGAAANQTGNNQAQAAQTSTLKAYTVTYTSGTHGTVCAHSIDEVKSWHASSIASVDHDYRAADDASCAH